MFLRRALVQRCPYPRANILVTIAGIHQGLYGIPLCPINNPFCIVSPDLMNSIFSSRALQKTLTVATFWHNPLNETEYKKTSTFLADINNENFINKSYIERLQTLEKFILVKYTLDEMVRPRESEWFGFYKPGQAKKVETLQESRLYREDRLGLKQMDQDGKLVFLSNAVIHEFIDWMWIKANIVNPYLSK